MRDLDDSSDTPTEPADADGGAATPTDAGGLDIDGPLVARYVAGTCSPAERAQVASWLTVSPRARELVQGLEAVWRLADDAARPARRDLARAWNHVSAAIGAQVTPGPVASASNRPGLPSPTPSRTLRPGRLADAIPERWPQGMRGRVGALTHGREPFVNGPDRAARIAIAAMVVIVLGVGAVVWRWVGGGPGGMNAAPTNIEYATTAGQRLTVTLVDGTQMILAPASRARLSGPCRGGLLAARCSGVPREVGLEGEAYFMVVHDAAHPFVVRARGAVARDVGTAFDVRAYPEDAGARIAVAEGTVAVAMAEGCAAGRSATIEDRAISPLAGRRSRPAPRGYEGPEPITGNPCEAEAKAGDMATVTGGGVAVEHGADLAALTAWRQGRLVFDNTPLPEVVREIGRAYGVDVTLGDSALAGRTVTTSFEGSESVDNVLESIGRAVGAQVERNGRRMVLSRRVAGRALPLPLSTAQAGRVGA